MTNYAHAFVGVALAITAVSITASGLWLGGFLIDLRRVRRG